MKKSILFLSLIVSFCTLSQKLPEISLKNGIAYYSFTHKLTNTKKCISSYFDAQLIDYSVLPIQQKILNVTSQFGYKHMKNGIDGVTNFTIQLKRELKNLKCNDTVRYGTSNFLVSLKDELLWRPQIIEFGRKKILNQKLTACIGVVFLSKNEYKLTITDIQYKFISAKGFNAEYETYKLGEYYEKLQKLPKVTSEDIEFINFIESIMKKADEIILNALIDTYSVDEL